jgi:hypothetical protein
MAPSFDRLDDFRLNSMNVEAECSNCGHAGVVDGPKLWRWFAIHRWDASLSKVGDHLRCSVCRRRPTKLTPTSSSPSIDFGPRSEGEWKAAVARLRR